MKDYMELDSAAQDMLKELGNIGTGNAITALSAMLGKEIVMECPEVRVVGFNEVPDTLGGMEAIRVGVLVQTGGDMGSMQAEDGTEINFYMVVPVYREEIEYKLEFGMEALDKRFCDRNLPMILDIHRPNYCEDFRAG